MKTLCFSEGISYASMKPRFSLLRPVVLQLPTELLQAIMLLACHGVYPLYLSSGSRVALQHTLLQVCRRWRLTALSYPHLWSDIHLLYTASKFCASASLRLRYHQHHLVNALIATRDLSLRCYITMELPFQYYHLDGVHAAVEILSTLIATSERWVELDIDIKDDQNHTVQILPALRGRITSLVKLRLKYSVVTLGDDERSSLAEIFSDAPQLTNVSLVCDKSIKFVLPLKQLRCLKFNKSTAELDLPNLTHATNLERFVFRSSGLQHPLGEGKLPIYNSSVKSLEITGTPILDTLTLPATYRIILPPQADTYTDHSKIVSSFNNFVQRSQCKVITLHITSTMSPDVLRSITPSLSFLDRMFVRCPVSQDLDKYRFLMDPDILPALNKLSVKFCFGAVCNRDGRCTALSRKRFQFLSDILQARNLRSVSIHLKSPSGEAVCKCENEEHKLVLLSLKDDPRVGFHTSFSRDKNDH